MFRETCRAAAADLLPVVVGRCMAGVSRAADVAAFATVAGIGGLVAPARPTVQAPEGDGGGSPAASRSASEGVNAAVGALNQQLQALLVAAAERALEPGELAALARVAAGLGSIERARAQILIRGARQLPAKVDALLRALRGLPEAEQEGKPAPSSRSEEPAPAADPSRDGKT